MRTDRSWTRIHPGYLAGARAVASLAPAAVGFGLSFGALADSASLDALQVGVMSATTFAGSAQFAAASIIEGAGGAAAAVAAGILLNARYSAIGLTVASELRGPVWRRALESQLIVDESWAVATGPDGRVDGRKLVGAGLFLYPLWVGSSVLGVLGAGLIGNPERLGLDAAFPAVFVALLAPQLRNRRALAAALLGVAIALTLVPLAPAGVPIIAASLGVAVGWRKP